MTSLEDQLLAERQRMWRRFAHYGFAIAFAILVVVGILAAIGAFY
jgi:hypothetical protein